MQGDGAGLKGGATVPVAMCVYAFTAALPRVQGAV